MTTEEHLAQIEATIRRYASASFVLSVTVTPDIRPGHQAYVVGRVIFVDHSRLHFREFVKEVQGAARKVMYTYHYQTAEGQLIFRYDNSRHRPALEDVLAEIAATKGWM